MGLAWSHDEPPYFHARLGADGSVEVEGLAAAALGHRVEVGRGRPPAGNWVEWAWDGSMFTLRTDRYRSYPVYLAVGEDEIACSPSVECLLSLGVSRELDEDAISVFLTLGHFVGEDTAFRAIRQLPGNAALRWRVGHFEIEADPPRRTGVQGTREENVAACAESVRVAVQRCIPDAGAYVMPISGGRDSRHLLLELLHAGHRPTRAVTAHHHQHVWGGDVPYAAKLCQELGVEHEALTPGPLIAEEWQKNRVTGYNADEHAWFAVVGRAMTAGGTHSYEGLNGSTAWIRDFYSPKMARLSDEGRFEDLARTLGRKEHGQPRYLSLLAPAVREDLGAERAVPRITAELERHAHEAEPYLAFRFWARAVGELNLPSTVMVPGLPAVYTPFMDPDVTDLAWSVPSQQLDDDFHADVIDHHFPEFKHIAYRPKTKPSPSRAFLREINRSLFDLLWRHSDGSLVDRVGLMRRTALGMVSGSDWITWGRRSALTTWLVQLEIIARGGDLGVIRPR